MSANVTASIARPGVESINSIRHTLELSTAKANNPVHDQDFDTDSIMEIARSEGFEAALEKLSGNDLDLEVGKTEDAEVQEINTFQEGETIEDDIYTNTNETLGETLDEKNNNSSRTEKEIEKVPVSLSEKVEALSERVSKLEGTDLTEALLQVILLYEEFKDEEEQDPDLKISLLELFISAIGRIILEVAPGGQEAIEKNGRNKGNGNRKTKVNNLREFLAKRQQKAPSVIENKAA